MRRDVQPSVMMGLGTPRPCNESQWTGSTRPEDGIQKSHHSGKSIPNCREHGQGVSACKPTADKKFAPESQNRRKEKNIDPVIEYTYTLRGTTERTFQSFRGQRRGR